jgi:GntR family transcriptional regulator of arabinose operon
MGIEAAKWIVAAVEKESSEAIPQQSIVYEPELIIRNSTSVPNKELLENK